MIALPLWTKSRAAVSLSFILWVAFGCNSGISNATAGSGQFNVTANIVAANNPTLPTSVNNPTLPTSVFCRTSPALAFGALVTVVCATGVVVDVTAASQRIPWVPIQDGTYRFVLPQSYSDGLPSFFDSYAKTGTEGHWSFIQLADRDYYQFLVRW